MTILRLTSVCLLSVGLLCQPDQTQSYRPATAGLPESSRTLQGPTGTPSETLLDADKESHRWNASVVWGTWILPTAWQIWEGRQTGSRSVLAS